MKVGTATLSTTLAGTGPAGRTLLRVNSGAGNWVGQGQSYLVTDAQTPMRVSFDSPYTFQGQIPNDASWVFTLSSGALLTTGTHRLTDGDDGGYSLNLGGYGRGCTIDTGTVTISQVTYANGQPENFDFSFSGSCGSGASNDTISGEIAYRATTTPVAASAPFLLHTGTVIPGGHSITDNPTGTPITLAVTTAGRAVLTDGSKTLWTSPATAVNADDRLVILADGQLALIRASGSVLWATPAAAGSNAFADVQSDGNLVLYTAGYVPVWATNTAQPA